VRIIVTDTSCMIDLRKAALLESLFELPYTFVMPDTLFEDEWLCLTPDEKDALRDRGLEVRELPGPSVERAARYFNEHRRLKLNDCFALALSEDVDDSILLTGDGTLRRVAEEKGVEVRGVLWTIDELENHEVVSLRTLHEALELFRDDDLVFLPEAELVRRIRRLSKLL
jgi:predicted nucleic acid-binding protein